MASEAGKGYERLHARTKISHDEMAANWMELFGGEWEVMTLKGKVLHTAESYRDAREWGLANIPTGDDFSVRKKRCII
jgi:hypothetical protein